jgi:hypothetical protein
LPFFLFSISCFSFRASAFAEFLSFILFV